MPKFEQRSINIFASYPGASAKLMEASVTTPLEDAISGIEGIDTVQSESSQGDSSLELKIKSGFDVDVLANKIRNKISLATYKLPSSIRMPTVISGWGSMELMDYGFTDSEQSLESIRDYIDRYIKDHIQQIPGVANVSINGANQLAMRISLNPKKMTALNLDINDVRDAINKNNVELPAGMIHTNQLNYPINANTKLKTISEFRNLVIKNEKNRIIRLNDIATVALDADNSSPLLIGINHKPGILLEVYNTTEGNPIATAKAVEHMMTELQEQMPATMKVTKFFDQTIFMKESIHEVYLSIFFAIFCVGLIIFLFLGKIRTSLVPIITIPICLMSSFGLMYLLGFTINVITLIAIVLSIGLVVDDAIVMLENIHRHITAGLTPLKASLKGSKEISFAVIAMTITLAAVYAPIGLMSGGFSNVYRSFAFTLAGAVIISGFVALTLTPMMCAKLLKKPDNRQIDYESRVDLAFKKISKQYQNLLNAILKHRVWIIILTLVLGVLGYFIFNALPKGALPADDMGLVTINYKAPVGGNVTYNNDKLKKINALLNPVSSVVASNVTFATESNSPYSNNRVLLTLKPFNQRDKSAAEVSTDINSILAKYPELNAFAYAPSFGGSKQHQLKFYILSSGTYLDLYHLAQSLKQELKEYPGLSKVDTFMNFNSQQYDLSINRELAANLHVDIESIDTTIANLLGGMTTSTFNLAGRDYDVVLQASDGYLHSLDSLNDFTVRSNSGKLIPISAFITTKPSLEQVALQHYNRLRAAEISADLAPGYKIGDAVAYLQKNLPKLLPHNVKYAFTGMAKHIIENSSSAAFIFILAIIFIYLVLSAQFESFIDPLIILFSVPLSIVSALAALKIFNGSIDIYTTIGLVTLIGLISKHGILITQFANELQLSGTPMKESLITAASTRLKPILMTTSAMIFGALPLLFTTGGSAASRHEIGIVIIAGLFFGTFFSLIVVPVAYYYANSLKKLNRS